MFESWAFVAIFSMLALSVPLIAVGLGALVGPRRPGPIKQSTYECGLETIGETWVQFKVQYYVFAMIFLIFDVETVFLYPWAVAYNRLTMFALVEMAIFLTILGIGLVYAWRKGALEWI